MAKQEDVKPWERQPDETAKQFEAFRIYRDLGDERTTKAVSLELGKSLALIQRWSSANKWVERCGAWDMEQDRILRLEQLKDIKKMRRRHADLASAVLEKAAAALEIMEPEEIRPSDLSRMLDIASKLERVSRGDVGDVIEQRDGGDAIEPVQIYLPDNRRDNKEDPFADLEL